MTSEIPSDLQESGKALYESLISERKPSAAHKTMILNAARMADMLDKIELELALNPNLTVVNGQGTRTVNPLISEARMIAGALSQILAKLGVAELPKVKSGEKTLKDQLAEQRKKREAKQSTA